MKLDDRLFVDQTTKFVEKPDAPQFRNYRKYLIILSNILLSEYCNLKLKITTVDYETICDYDQVHKDLIAAVGKWAEEINPAHAEVLTQISVCVDKGEYPLAFYSTQSLRMFPFNTVNPVIKKQLIGWDEKNEDFTFEQFAEDLSQRAGRHCAGTLCTDSERLCIGQCRNHIAAVAASEFPE